MSLHLCVLQALLEVLSKVVSREKRNRMNLWAVATIMAPNLFLHKAVPSRLTEGAEKGHAEKAADVMRLLIRYQDLLWTVGDRDGSWFNKTLNPIVGIFRSYYTICSPHVKCARLTQKLTLECNVSHKQFNSYFFPQKYRL